MAPKKSEALSPGYNRLRWEPPLAMAGSKPRLETPLLCALVPWSEAQEITRSSTGWPEIWPPVSYNLFFCYLSERTYSDGHMYPSVHYLLQRQGAVFLGDLVYFVPLVCT